MNEKNESESEDEKQVFVKSGKKKQIIFSIFLLLLLYLLSSFILVKKSFLINFIIAKFNKSVSNNCSVYFRVT